MIARRYSRQREVILQALQNSDQHPTADMLYGWLKPEHPSLSLGTVYRNLNQMAEDGVINRMAFPVERYDAWIEPHSHFRCSKCGGVYDMPKLPYDAQLNRKAEELSGHQVERYELIFGGICLHCTPKHG